MRSAGIVVIGGGIAAQSLCEEVRARDPKVPLTLICGESCLPYDRVRLSEILVSGEEPGALALRPEEWYEDNAVETLLGRRVEAIDAAFGRLVLDDGETLSYDDLVLATGSRPLMPPLPGLALPGVIPFRDPADCDAIRGAVAADARIAVIGGGLLGLEAAYGVAARGAQVTVVHLMERLMERQLDDEAAALLRPAMERLGVKVLLGRQTERVLGSERAEGLRFAGGEEIAADLVVVSIGIRAEAHLAAAAGIEVGRGVLVDDAMRTSAPSVWAVGECAEHRGVVYGLVAPIREQAAVAAASLLGEEARYEGSLQWAKLKVMGVDLVSIGVPEGGREAAVADVEAPAYRKLVLDGGRAAGAILLGDTRGSEDLLAAITAGEEVTDPLERLAASAATSACDLPDAAQICNCNGVCKGEIVGAVTAGGCATAREVMASTRAGTGCGSCKATVVELVAQLTGAAEEPAYLCPCRRQTREELAAVIRERGLEAVSEVADACGTGRECGQCKPALAYLVSEVNANRHREERAARFINDRVHANIQNDGTFSVVPRMYGGVTTPDELRRIADAAERYEVRMVKVTGGQRIDLLGVSKADLPKIWEEIGMPSGHAYAKAVRTVKTCVGEEFCRFGLGDSIDLGVRLEREWEGLHTPAKVKSGVSGCPRNCAEATVKDIGIVAIEGGWQVRVGGAAGSCVREADILATVETADEVIRLATVVLQYYRENADYKERLYDFVPRVGLEEIRRVVLDPERAAELLERFRIAKAAVTDPWLEREAPYHPRQFADLDDGAGEPIETPIDALVGPPAEGVR
ncbi:MAG TPA: nitrite reductase large subunit NirB [Solirubrobacterales bacterium]|nr:nitrite reductase large subunit NirB [Solirubrobacterales bacterium]